MTEAAAGLGVIASFVIIMRFLVDILIEAERREEAKAVEKATQAIQAAKQISQTQAKETFARTLAEELGKEKARPLIEYAEIVGGLFPYRPSGKLLQYGVAVHQLIPHIRQVLKRLGIFEQFGKEARMGTTIQKKLVFRDSGRAFWGIWRTDVPVSTLGVALKSPQGYLNEGKPIRAVTEGERFTSLTVDLEIVLGNSHYYVYTKRAKPLAIYYAEPFFDITTRELTLRRSKELRLNAARFGACMTALLSDTKYYVEKLASEVELSREQETKFSLAIGALKQLSVAGRTSERS